MRLFPFLLLVFGGSIAPCAYTKKSLEVRLYEIEVAANKALGYDWYLGNTPGSTPGQPGAGQSGTVAAPAGISPGSAGPNSPQGGVATMSGILTDPQFKVVVRALEQRSHSRMIAAPTGVTVAEAPLMLKRPDGWHFKILPSVNPASQQITLALSVTQDKGEYAGFQLNSEARVGAGETAVFSDVFSVPAARKGAPATQKRLVLTITPNVHP